MVVSSFPTNISVHGLVKEYGVEYVYEAIQELPDYEAQKLYYDWEFWARETQLMPAWAWRTWLLKSGRGAGKTRTGAETTRKKSDTVDRIHLVGRTAADVRDVMIEGESGILAISPPWNMPVYKSTTRSLVWPNGSKALCFSAEEPNLLRGPQCGFAWADEIASWRYLKDTWNNLMFGLRLGENPQCVATSTPRPVEVVKDLVSKDGITVHVTTESTFANRGNVAEAWMQDIISQYEGTRLGRQEIGGEVLDDNPNALWNTDLLDKTRVSKIPQLDKIVIAVDPSVADKPTEGTSECGIIAAGIKGMKRGTSSHGYILGDESIKGNPVVWGNQVIAAVHKYQADEVVAEANNGGALVKYVLQSIDPDVKVVLVHAARGKRTRAEPVATLYEKERVHHLGNFAELETQLTEWEPGMPSPDRLDANVWAITHLMIDEKDAKQQVKSW